MNPMEQIISLVLSYLKLLHELVLLPFLRLLRPPQPEAEVTLDININSPPLREEKRSRVQFGNLEIRTYETVVGDNPSCSGGPPLAIGWNYNLETTSVDAFEKQPCRHNVRRPKEHELVLDRAARERRLYELGCTLPEMASATRRTSRVRAKRRQSVDTLGSSFIEEKVEGVKKSIARSIGIKKNSKAMYKEWQKVGAFVQQEDRPDDFMNRKANSCMVLGREDSDSTMARLEKISDSTEESSMAEEVAAPECGLRQRKGKLMKKIPAHRRRLSMS